MKRRNNLILIFWVLGFVFAGLGGILLTISLTAGVAFLIFAFFALVFAIITTSTYNKFVYLNNKVEQSLALVDIQLKLRFDLVPNLVAVVKEYEKHEKEVFTEVTKLRNLALKCDDEKQKLQYANDILPKIKQIVVIAENYPELKAETVFKSLMNELVEIEDKLVAARRIYDSNVNEYNTTIQIFPNNMFAKWYNFTGFELYKIDSAEKINVNIDLSSKKDKK